MHKQRLSPLLGHASLLVLLAALSACTSIERGYNSAYDSVSRAVSSDDSSTSRTKVEVKSPAAAPYQDVKAQEISGSEPIVLGAMSDKPAITIDTETAAPPAAPIVPQAMQTNTQPAPIASDALANALLTIRFNQPHVYYEDALTKAVSDAERAKPGVTYDVLSTVPDLSSLTPEQQTKLSGRAKDNLRNVVVKIQQMGVPADRIRIADQTLKIRSQEIRVYVK